MGDSKRALIVIDVQRDFCPGGAMAVEEGNAVVEPINRLLELEGSDGGRYWKRIVASADWHPAGHVSFAESHPGAKAYETREIDGLEQNLWPIHCLAGSEGADFHPDLDVEKADIVLRKGHNRGLDSYSVFFENDGKTPTGLHGYLGDFGVEKIVVCGLAYDWCVYFSAVDARRLGYEVYLIEGASRAVDLPKGFADERREDMRSRGIHLLDEWIEQRT